MRDIKSIVWTIILIILIATGLSSKLVPFIINVAVETLKLFVWLFQLSLTDFGLSPIFEIVIKLLTFVISYAFVGLIFKVSNFFDSDIMRITYFVISTIIGFVLSFVVKLFQEHIIVISWSILGISIISMLIYSLSFIKKDTL